MTSIERPGVKEDETAISRAAVPDPEIKTVVKASSILKAWRSLDRIDDIKSENSFYRWQRSGKVMALRTFSVILTGPGLSRTVRGIVFAI